MNNPFKIGDLAYFTDEYRTRERLDTDIYKVIGIKRDLVFICNGENGDYVHRHWLRKASSKPCEKYAHPCIDCSYKGWK